MKKLLLSFLVLTASAPAFSGWVSYQRTADSDELYDTSIISREGAVLKLWTLINYSSPITSLEGQELLSEKALTTVDCRARKTGSEKIMKYSRNHAEGALVSIMETVLRLTSAAKGSADEALLEKICR